MSGNTTTRLQLVMALADKLSAPMRQVTQRTNRFNQQITNSREALNRLGNTRSAINNFRELRRRTNQTAAALTDAQRDAARIAQQFNRTSNPTRQLTRRMQEATRHVRQLQQQQQSERQELQCMRGELRQAGVSTNNLAQATRRITQQTDRYNQQLEEQQQRLARVRRAEERMGQLRERNSNLKSKLMGDTAKVGAAVFAVKKLTDAYGDMVSAKGEIGSLGIDEKGQEIIAAKAREYSNQWSKTTTTEFIRASYDIKSGIASLGDAAVGEFTKIAALTGGATKSSTEEMTSLFASGYAIYRKQFDGFAASYIKDWKSLSEEEKDIKFGEMLSAGISSSVQMFKTDGSKVSQALSSLGATATAAGASISEQFSVLGMLSASMEGGEAATKYARFIQKAGKASEKLGLNFFDAENRLLPAVDILRKIKEEYGELDEVEKLEIFKAFGSKEAVGFIDTFLPKIDELDDTIGVMQKNLQSGMAITETMAESILIGGPNFTLMGQRFNNLAISVGRVFAPAMSFAVELLGRLAESVAWFIDNVPIVPEIILYGVSALLAFKTATMACRVAMLAWNVANMAGIATTNALNLASIRTGAIQLALAAKTKAVTAAQWLWNTALMANPIGLVIMAIGGLIATAAYLIDDWGVVGEFFSGLWESIKSVFNTGWEYLKSLLAFTPLGMVMENWAPLTEWFGSLWATIKALFSQAWQWIQDTIVGPIMAIKDTLGAAWDSLFGDDEKSVEVTQKVKQMSDNAAEVIEKSPAMQSSNSAAPLTGQASRVNQTHNQYNVSVEVKQPNATPEEINRAVAKALDEHQRKQARSVRGNLHD
ncbi:phage tail tape measure protein [Spartinivicinus poritis]|uniref:Phage tail tape measure protein n=1 Tax=Spartinivicinus poritis TaxID=2994640 RepID=A0ABT5UEI3_9GAMM|nr:phage tail tape measure protein [Spartinivicinus sp. A2-2]MDE1464781.1 phage tail tape measure protein [Spartinivicinus sp. A2-2]